MVFIIRLTTVTFYAFTKLLNVDDVPIVQIKIQYLSMLLNYSSIEPRVD